MVQFQNVSKVYENGLAAVKDISFTIKEGEFVFLIGPSGSGKTTLIELLIRDLRPSEGKIYLDDQDITHVSRRKVYKIRRQIGVIFQDYKLIEDKTSYENVSFAMEAAGKTRKEIKETVPYVLDIVGLSNRMDSFPVQLSGGEQQRVAIARAIANNPKILIADEPTGNLDPASAWDIVQVLTKINNWGTTVIMSTHGTDIVNTLNKRVIQMENGIVVRDDNEGQYEFSTDKQVEAFEEMMKKSKEEQKTNTSFKVNLSSKKKDNDEDDIVDNINESSEPLPMVDNPEKRGFFSRLFKRAPVIEPTAELEPDVEAVDEGNDEAILEEVSDESDTEVTTEVPKSDFVSNEDMEEKVLEEIDNDKTQKPKKEKVSKAKKSKKAKKEEVETPKLEEVVENEATESDVADSKVVSKAKDSKTDEKANVGLAGSNKEPQELTIDKELEKGLKEYSDMTVDHLNLPGKIIKDLKKAGFETVGKIISVGPEKLSENVNIDPEEVLMVAGALEKLVKEE